MVVTKIRQYGTQFWKADNNKINITSSQGKVISWNHIHNYIHCFSNGKLRQPVLLCESSQVIQYQEQSNLASQLLVRSKWQVRLCYATNLATALSIPIIFGFNHAKCFNWSKQLQVQYQTHLWFYCIMPIQSTWLCDTGSGKHRQIVNIQLPDVADSFEKEYWRAVPLPSADVSSVERIDRVHLKARERWGHIKS